MLLTSHTSPGVLLLDFNRPEKHNALNAELYGGLERELRAAQTDPESRAIVLTATGKSFCAGNDLADFDSEWPQPDEGSVYRFLTALYEVDVPVIAAVQGAQSASAPPCCCNVT